MAEDERPDAQPVEQQGDEAEMMARLQEEIRNLPVSEHLAYMLHSLSGLAVGRLGLTPDTADLRDPEQARLAIDAFKALVGVLENVRPAGEMAVHRGMLSQLQLAFAGALEHNEPGPESAPEPAPSEAESTDEAPAAADEASTDEAPPKSKKPGKGGRSGS